MDIQDQKRIVRRTTLAKRGSISAADREAAGRAIADAILALPEIIVTSHVMAFASFGSEIPTGPLVEALLASGRSVLMPFVDGRRMRAAAVTRPEDLAPGYRGIPEPPAPVAVDPEPGTVVLVPGVAFDAQGGRLGYGGGFYDAFLQQNAGLVRAGVCFDAQIVDRIPAESHDLPVSVIVTERRTIRPG